MKRKHIQSIYSKTHPSSRSIPITTITFMSLLQMMHSRKPPTCNAARLPYYSLVERGSLCVSHFSQGHTFCSQFSQKQSEHPQYSSAECPQMQARVDRPSALAPSAASDKVWRVELLWKKFFSDPSQWHDHRLEKRSLSQPDFQHKHTKDGLWIDGRYTPSWITSKLSALYQVHHSSTLENHSHTTKSSGVLDQGFRHLSVLCKQGKVRECLQFLDRLEKRDRRSFSLAYVDLLQFCGKTRNLAAGKQIHAHIATTGFESNLFVASTLVSMYCKCGHLVNAREVFDRMCEKDVVSWNVMIGGYTKQGNGREALEIFKKMKQEAFQPDGVTFLCLLNACASLGELEQGQNVHEEVLKSGLEADVSLANALVHMYARCGDVARARQLFDRMPKRDIVSWTAMIGGYTKHKSSNKAITLFQEMRHEGLKPDGLTYVTVLNACANLTALELGKQVHADIMVTGMESDIFVANALVDMYGKCGALLDARQVFDRISKPDVISWNTMIAGYCNHGKSEEAVKLFWQMEDVKPNRVTFISILSACSHLGLVAEGRLVFESMTQHYAYVPTIEHYTCMVDLLGRAGLLIEAYRLIKSMLVSPNGDIWRALLGACNIHGHLELAEIVTEHILALEPQNTAAYVLLSNIYGSSGRWEDKDFLRKVMQNRGVEKLPGHSIIEVSSKAHSSVLEDDIQGKSADLS
ncbi:hypothetical protein O6H91_Y197900 [Diphasiastrum complanatum]|nr:hypothetical protein O6H91_Y197900 [Diphasiastrum complanatum]KAJ7295318.1 hypothetical protein O6H91_Y197900 [Diphasiastrum complanatum]